MDEIGIKITKNINFCFGELRVGNQRFYKIIDIYVMSKLTLND